MTTPYLAHKPRVPNWLFIFAGSSRIRPEIPAPEVTGPRTAKKPPNSKSQVKAQPTPVRLYPWNTQDLSSLVAQHKAATPCPTAQIGSRGKKKKQSIFEQLWASKNSQNTVWRFFMLQHVAFLQQNNTALFILSQAVRFFPTHYNKNCPSLAKELLAVNSKSRGSTSQREKHILQW